MAVIGTSRTLLGVCYLLVEYLIVWHLAGGRLPALVADVPAQLKDTQFHATHVNFFAILFSAVATCYKGSP